MVVFVLAGGKSSRMGVPKILLPLAGRPSIEYVLDVAREIGDVIVVLSPELSHLTWEGVHTTVQEQPRGTGDAFATALRKAKDLFPQIETQNIVVLLGDCPGITLEALKPLLSENAPGLSVMGMTMHCDDGDYYGRLYEEEGRLVRIIEAKEATPEQRAIKFCNTGIFRFSPGLAFSLVPQLQRRADTGEYYLTDCVHLAYQQGDATRAIPTEHVAYYLGMNTPSEWSALENLIQMRLRQKIVENGVFLHSYFTIYFSFDTYLAPSVIVHPNVTFGLGVRAEKGAVIYPFSVLSNCVLEEGAQVGPFAHIRDGVTLGPHSQIGNFVEVKKSNIGAYSQAKHLSYLGDAEIGEEVTIGAGTVTCNYDGHKKHPTVIGNRTLVGVNSSLIAPLTIGENATIGAGSVISDNVSAEHLAVARATQIQRPLPSGSPHLSRKRRKKI